MKKRGFSLSFFVTHFIFKKIKLPDNIFNNICSFAVHKFINI